MPLNLPVQVGAVDRTKWDYYKPFLIDLGHYTDPETGAEGISLGDPPPAFAYLSPVVGDPGPIGGDDGRGWQCQTTTSGCTWTGPL